MEVVVNERGESVVRSMTDRQDTSGYGSLAMRGRE